MVKRFWKFSKKVTSLCWKIAEILVALSFVLGALLLYQLHNEPIDAMKYIPEIERALFPSDAGYHLQAEKVELTSDWSRDGLIQIDIENLKVLRGNDTTLFFVPKAQFSYDFWHIVTLNYMPGTIIIEKPFLEMIVDKQGALAVKTQESSTHFVDIKLFKSMLSRILAIHELNITRAHFCLKDERFNQQWDISDANLNLERRFRFSNRGVLNATLSGDGVKSRFLATVTLNRFSRILTLEMGLDKINLKKIASFIPVLQEADLNVQLSAKGELNIAKNHKKITDYISKIQFNAKTLKTGTINLMNDLDNLYQVESADINGSLGMGAKTLKIASSKIYLKNEKPIDFYLNVEGIDTFLNFGNAAELKTTLKATLYDVPTSHVPELWPSKQGPDAHAWVKKNLSKGFLKRSDFTLYFNGDELVNLFGDIHAEGVRVDYLNPMKPIDNVSAQVLLYPDKVRILANTGTIGDLSLERAELLFTDLDKDESWLQIDLESMGPVQQALELISSKPLEYPQQFGLKPSLISGTAKTFVHLSFPLLDNLETDQVQVAVHSEITKAKINSPLAYLGLKNGTFSLDVSNEGLEIVGDIFMKNSPLKFKWHEYFDPQKMISEYLVSGTLLASDIGGILPSLNPFIKGQLTIDFKGIKDLKEAYSGICEINAKEAWVDIAPLGVQKQLGKNMDLLISFSDLTKQSGNLNWDVRGSLSGEKDDLKIEGQSEWGSENFHLLLSNVLAGVNQFHGELKNSQKDFSLILKGENWQGYNLGKVLKILPKMESVDAKTIKNIMLDINLMRFALSKNKPIKEFSILGERQGLFWKNFHMQGIADEPFVLAYSPKKSQFQGSFSDVGDLLDRLDFSGRFDGGKISLVADQKKSGDVNGILKIENAELKETSFLMQAVTILGIVDAFRGKDIEFDEIEIPFVLTPDFKLSLEDAYAVGTNLGVTFKGQITVDEIDLSGSVVPAYAVNSLPGKIPVLGWLFRNGEGGGLINVPYTIKGSLVSPEVEWNALKTVAPGALGRLF